MAVPSVGEQAEKPTVRLIDPAVDAEALRMALDTISHALVEDGVSQYVARRGEEHDFHHAVFRGYLDSGPQLALATDCYSCAAFFGEVVAGPDRQQQQQQSGDQQHAQAAAGAAQAQAQAEEDPALRHVPQERRSAVHRLFAQPLLQQLVQEHGAVLCMHFIGCRPEQQGRGLGGEVLRAACALADKRRRVLYLEASSPRSKALYARHGFRHLADKPLAPEDPAAPVLAVMMRPPATATAAGDGQ